jgi:hypothetical protein
MAIKFDLIKKGDVVYDCHRYKMGNTKMSRMGCWDVRILALTPDATSDEVFVDRFLRPLAVKDRQHPGAFVSWNGNPPEWRSARGLSKLRRSPLKDRE